ncbi:uncharacterized protein LOC116027935 [Ipomoea triloba]|uniref:uncharacterized protein LOC116027935 n=1 Tax=Ipomoea triloba TaxID=35885 RepID=UPI00125E73A2|nr:uncharacterized protein LOC116027935 [Ipomoea triloba]
MIFPLFGGNQTFNPRRSMDMGVQILEIGIGVGIRGGRRQRRGSEILVGRREAEEGPKRARRLSRSGLQAMYWHKSVETFATPTTNFENGGVHCVVVLDCNRGGGSRFRHYLTTVRDVQYCIREAFNATEVGGGKRVNEANNRLSKMGEQNVKCLICPHISRLRRRRLTGGLGQVKFEKMRMTKG